MNLDLINSITNPKNRQFYLLAVILSIGSAISLVMPIGIMLFFASAYIIRRYGKEAILLLVVFLYFVVTSDLNEQIRLILNYAGLFLMGVVYVWEYGISIEPLKRVPLPLKILAIYTLASMTISMLGSDNPAKGSVYIVKQVIFFFITYVIYSFVRSDKDLDKWLRLFVITSTILAASLVQETISIIMSASSIVELGVIRTSGLYGNANAIASFFVVAIPVIMVIMIENKQNKRKYGLYLFLLLFNLFALLLTNSRAAVLGVMVSIFYLLYQYKKVLFYRLFYGGLFVVLLILLIDPLREFFMMAIRYERIFENVRGYYWQIAFDVIKENPIFGVGPGMFEENIYRYLPVRMNTFDEFQLFWAKSGTTHNFFLYRFSEYGIFGLFNAVFLIWLIFHFSGKILSRIGSNSKYRYIVFGIRGLSFGLMARAFLESSGFLTNGWITRDLPFWLAFLLLAYIYEQTSKSERARL